MIAVGIGNGIAFMRQAGGDLGDLPDPGGDVLIGELYNESAWADLSDFTVNGMSPGVSGAGIALSGGNGDFGQYMMFGETSNDENQTIRVRFQVTDKSGAAYGISIGRRRGIYTWGLDMFVQLDFSASQLNMWWSDSGQTLMHTINLATINTSDIVDLEFVQVGPAFTANYLNVTTAATASHTETCNMAASKNFRIPNTTRPCIWNHGGGCTIKEIEHSSASIANPKFLFIGDSKTVGFSAENIELSYPNLWKGTGSITRMAGDGEETAGIVANLPYMLNHITPEYIILCIGCNDLRGGVSSGVWQANYADIVDQLETLGAPIIQMLPIPENSLDQSALKSWIEAEYPSDDLVDPSVGWVAHKHISGDGVHPSATGFYHIFDALRQSGYMPTWVPRSSYMLEQYPGCVEVSSFTKLSGLYTGDCIQVERSSDSTLQAIPFDGDYVDTAAFTAFVGGGTGYLARRYDQTGRGVDRVYASGARPVLTVASGKMHCNFDGVNDKSVIAAKLSGNCSSYFVAANKRADISNAIDVLFTTKGSGLSDPGFAIETSNKFASTTQRDARLDIGLNGTTGTLYKNGALDADAVAPIALNELFVGSFHTTDAANTDGIVFGNFPDGSDNWPGQNQFDDFAIWPYLHSSTIRNALTAMYGANHGVTVV